jgi:hypothetical protein
LAIWGAAAVAQDRAAPAAGPAVQRAYEVGAFDSIGAAGPHRVIVAVGGRHSVRAEGPADVLQKMEVVVEKGDVQIRPRREYRRNYNWRNERPATFYVTAPLIKSVSLAGSGDMSIDRVEGQGFSASVAGSGNLDIASLRVADADLSVAGSGDIVARGSARRANVSVAGSGNIRTGQVAARTASVSVVGSGDVELNAAETVSVSIIGGGDVNVSGPARCTVSRMGGGKVRCGG